MKDWPFLFKPEMALATLDDSKTQTRRLVTPRATLFDGQPWPGWAKGNIGNWDWDEAFVDMGPSPIGNPGPYLQLPYKGAADHGTHRIYPRVQPGDRIWGKEVFALSVFDPAQAELDIKEPDHWSSVSYKAGYENTGEWTMETVDEAGFLHSTPMDSPPWKSSLHMPRWATRILGGVVRIRIERVQDITEEDALAEGIMTVTKDGTVEKFCVYDKGDHSTTPWQDMSTTAKGAFKALWNSIHAKPGYNWDGNPWVIVYDFRRIEL